MKKSIYRPRKDTPFRPLCIPETFYGITSLLQRAQQISDLRAVVTPYMEEGHLEFTIGQNTYCIYPKQHSLAALWDRTHGAFIEKELTLENLITSLNQLIKEERKRLLQKNRRKDFIKWLF